MANLNINNNLASETEKGIVEEATQAEVNAGTDTGGTGAKVFVAPSKLLSLLGSYLTTASAAATYLTIVTAAATYQTVSGLFASVMGLVLTGFAAGSNAAVTATDTLAQALAKFQGQINARATTSDVTNAVANKPEFFGVAMSDETTVLAAASTSVPRVTIHAPYAMTLTRVYAGLTTAGTGASNCIVDIHLNGTTIMSVTKILFSASTKLSADGTLSTTAVAAGDLIEFFLDQRDTNNVAAGLKCYIIGHQ